MDLHVSATRRRRGVVHTYVICLEDHITTLQAKEKLTNTDHVIIQWLLKRLETLDGQLKTHHFAVTDLVEEET